MSASTARNYFGPLALDHGLNRPSRRSCRLIDFAVLVLGAGESYRWATTDREYCLDLMAGVATVRVNSNEFPRLGGRANVFAGPPSGVYAGCRSQVEILAHTSLELALGSCPSHTPIAPYAFTPDQAPAGQWGQGNTERHYRYLLNADRPSERLWFAEVTVANGCWATYPPHKHEDVPGDLFQEEMYYYRTDPAQGFGFCASFEGKVGTDHAFLIRDSTLQQMPHGYHTVTAAPGYRICYLAVYAGRDKQHRPTPHPLHVHYEKNLR